MAMKKVIALGMSGGVDSSMALEYLKKDWDTIVGANHVVWHGVKCSSPEVIDRARVLCGKEKIPFYCLDVSDEFNRQVAKAFVKDYLHGLTPNPCVICNRFIKFTFFYDRLKEQLVKDGIMEPGDQLYYSTGHYVRLVERAGSLFLARARDLSKDQSYMLYRLPKELLARCIFPLGDKLKKDVKKEAQALGMPSSSVKESQDICFIEGSYGDFIEQYTGKQYKPGSIYDTQGNRLGLHRGYIHYTIGQRKGLGLGSGPWYVTQVIPEKNRVMVGREDEQGQTEFTVRDLNWFIGFKGPLEAGVKVRYNSGIHPCTAELRADGTVQVLLKEKTVITPGQSAVFYDGDIVLGGGIIA
ncbi:MAG: tRNA 2-thiouridine(34) synthase MnmA [Spirochaetia bacterium]|nr:tRNA 2-thiouridine(34) synthase MnmA [Spirochaetia bacterium]